MKVTKHEEFYLKETKNLRHLSASGQTLAQGDQEGRQSPMSVPFGQPFPSAIDFYRGPRKNSSCMASTPRWSFQANIVPPSFA